LKIRSNEFFTRKYLGYSINYIQGFYLRNNKKKLFISTEESMRLENINNFIGSDEYKILIEKFENDFKTSLDLIEKIRSMKSFRQIVQRNRKITKNCTPDYKLTKTIPLN
jgi:hypothetical protein